HQKDGQLVETLKDPVEQVLRESFRESPQEFGDALYPVMGPAIRKSIAHTLKAFAQQINQTLEYSLTLKGLSWRFRAARAGVPFASYVIQQSLQYRVEQAYLISRENGLLMGHVHHDASRIKDSDAVSAMFTAIQDFVKESFSPDRSGRLETADMGEFTLWAVHGPHALLVCVIRGVPPQSLRSDLSAILERLHFRYGDVIRHYSGETATISGVEEELQRCLQFEAARPSKKRKRKIAWPLVLILLALVAAGAYAAWTGWQHAQRQQQLLAAIDATPGLYVGNIQRDGDRYTLSGLQDPLADSLDEVAARAGLQPEQLQGDLRPYQSLDADIRLRRATRLFAPPDGVNMQPQGNALVFSGTASSAWISAARNKAAVIDTGWDVQFAGVQVAEWNELTAQVEALNNRRFHFETNAELLPEDAAELGEYATAISELVTLARRTGATINITVTGHTDGLGTIPFNNALAAERTERVMSALRTAGVDPARITRASDIAEPAPGALDPEKRRVDVSIALIAPELPL
ncbi:MAG: hypothetical protein RIA65_11315, partial [Woeseia sp.]